MSGTAKITTAGTQGIAATDTFSVDGFGRWRVSSPTTLFDAKQLQDNLPLFWDEEIVNNGGSTVSTHSTTDAATTMTVDANSGDYVIRQTKMRFNYQPGKSQLILSTFVLGDATTGVSKKIGYFNTSTVSPYTANIDGLYIEQDGTTQYLVQAKNGSATQVAQASWNIDAFDGTGPSGVTIDWTKTQILIIDFEWLGVGRVRMGFVVDGIIYYAHEFLNANSKTAVYMSSPNHSMRYEIRSTGGTDSITQICSSVASEGGEDALGVLFYASTAGTHVDCAVENTVYAIIGIRLKSTHLANTIRLLNMAIQLQTANHFGEWILLLNPTVAGTFTYGNITNSSCQYATGATANTVTGGTKLSGGFLESGGTLGRAEGGSGTSEINNALRLGSKIDGTVDEIVLCFRPIAGTTNADVEGSLFWRELV